MQTVAFSTLGCRLNQTETAIIAKSLEDNGYQVIKDVHTADICVINTCTVTGQSDSKCRQTIRGIQKKNPAAKIAVIGCFSEVSSEQIDAIGGIHIILGNQEKLNLLKYLPALETAKEPIIRVGSISKESFSIDTIGQHLGSTRANLKVQDGCNFFCSYCIIPFARGRSRSRELENIRQEALKLAENGVKEVILTGINVGTYEYKSKGFLDVLDIFNDINDIQRVRISSIEPTTVGTEIFSLMADPGNKLVPYLHLPLQSGSEAILQAMRRRYTIEEYKAYIEEARKSVPDICIGTDILVGFPGETDEMFDETYNNLKCFPVNYFHVFPYAERKGTQSVKIKEKVNGKVISRRAAILRELSAQKRDEFVSRYYDQTVQVLFEGTPNGDRWQGYSGNYIRVEVTSTENLKNQIRTVKILRSIDGLALGQLI